MTSVIGAYYHAYNRGNRGQEIFLEQDNYEYLIWLISKNSLRFYITVIAYCLMPNHYHLLLRQDGDVKISRFIQSTFQSYSQAFNNRFGLSGRLFDNPKPSKHIDNQKYLMHVCRYIHRNPLEAKLVTTLSDWKYSNYKEFIDEEYKIPLVYEWFGSPREYQEFVESEYDGGYRQIKPYLFE